MADKIYIGDIGTEILIDCVSDISSATEYLLLVQYPDGSVEEWAATISGTTMLLYYSDEDTFTMAGEYKVQSYVVLSDGTWRGETCTITVYDPFD